MSFRKNQHGYVLILVLLIITIIGIVAPLIITNIMNSVSQYQKVEGNLQATKIAQMGEVYSGKLVIQAKEKAMGNLTKEETWEDILDDMKTELEGSHKVELEEDRYKFEIMISYVYDSVKDERKFHYEVIPFINDKGYENYGEAGDIQITLENSSRDEETLE